MGKRPLLFRSFFATALALSLVAPSLASSALRPYAVFVDGASTRGARGFFDGAHVVVSLEDIARALKYSITRAGPARVVNVHGDKYTFAPGDPDVLMNNDPVAQTSVLPVVRDGMLFVSIADLQSILSLEITAHDTRIDVAGEQVPVETHSSPLLRPRISTYIASISSGNPESANQSNALRRHFTVDATNALIIHAGISDYGGSKMRDLSFTTDGARLRGTVAVSALENSSRTVNGQITSGTRERYLQAGYEDNPFNGLIFSAPGGIGISVRRDSLSYGSEHDSLGRTLLGLRRDLDSGAVFYGIIRANGNTTPILGQRSAVDGVVKVSREFWVTGQGSAASLGVASQGRLFGEAIASVTVGVLPLTTAEAPERLNLGFRVSRSVTLRAGAISGYRQRATSFFGTTFFGDRGVSGSIQFSGGNRSASLNYAALTSSLIVSYSSAVDGGTSWALNGSATRRGRLWDLSAFHSSNGEDDMIRMHSILGSAPILGIERVVSFGKSHVGPVLGVTVPLGSSSSFEATDHPIGSGRALGFGFNHRILFAPHARTRRIMLQNAAPAELFVDDHFVRRIDTGTSAISLESGTHRVQARSADGNHASLPVLTGENTGFVDVALLQVRSVTGRIIQSDLDPAGRKISLEHIQVTLQPGDIQAETDRDGAFVFPAFPLTTGSRVSILKESLPDDLTVGDDVPVDTPIVLLTVKTRVKVHRKKF